MNEVLGNPNLINNVVLLLLAMTTGYNTYISALTNKLAAKTEVNTNSMKDALVAATVKASHAEGLEQGHAEAAVTAATLAKGQLLGHDQSN